MIKITIDKQSFDECQAAMASLSKRIDDLRWLWPDFAGEFYKREMEVFNAQGEGEWRALSVNYAKWKSKYYPGQPLLVLTGDLRSSLVARLSTYSIYEAEAKSLTLGSSVPYGNAHQYGYAPRNLPARPPIIIDDATERKMGDVAEREFADYCASLGFGVTRH